MKTHTPHDIFEWVFVSVMMLSFPNCLRHRVDVVHSGTARFVEWECTVMRMQFTPAFPIPNAPISMMEHLDGEKCMNLSNSCLSESIGPHNPQLFPSLASNHKERGILTGRAWIQKSILEPNCRDCMRFIAGSSRKRQFFVPPICLSGKTP
jgi:hypothetical protein